MGQGFGDIIVLYPSVDDVEPGLWVAHSARTDQVGVGHDLIEAIRELALSVRTLLEEAAKDPTVRVEQPAPLEVLRKLQGATSLPKPLLERVRAALHSYMRKDSDEYWDAESPGPEPDADRVFSWEIHAGDLCVV